MLFDLTAAVEQIRAESCFRNGKMLPNHIYSPCFLLMSPCSAKRQKVKCTFCPRWFHLLLYWSIGHSCRKVGSSLSFVLFHSQNCLWKDQDLNVSLLGNYIRMCPKSGHRTTSGTGAGFKWYALFLNLF